MKSLPIVRAWLSATIMAVALLAMLPVQAAVPAGWKDSGFSIDATGVTLHGVLEEFARVYGVRLSISLTTDALMKGRLKADNGTTFLDRLAQPYKFRWFVYNETLYIVPRGDNASIRLEVGEDAVQDAKAALIGLGLFDPRFGWGELPDEGVVIISGPREYVNLARSILRPEEKKILSKGKQVMVFRLKYASATDRVITVRGKSETIPGVKTILSRLLFGPDSGERLTDVRAQLDVDRGKRTRKPKVEPGGARAVGESLFGSNNRRAQDNSEGEEIARSSPPKSSSADARPRVEADPSLNAIMIYDNASKRDVYQSLIEELDSEPKQVEIEALIIDIDRSKLSELGVEWGAKSHGGNFRARMNSTTADSRGVELPIPGSTLLISNAARFYARLKAMEGAGEARVLATPTVLTLDNVAAVLDLSQTKYVPLLGERIADLADVTAGTMLRVIPRVVGDGPAARVRLEIDIEDGSLGDADSNTNVTRSMISTQAIVDLQQTLMIGGYHAESMSRNKEKLPVLGDAPLVGGLFRSTNESYRSRQRLFLITPRIIGTIGAVRSPVSNAAPPRAPAEPPRQDQPADGLSSVDAVPPAVAGGVRASAPRVPATTDMVTVPVAPPSAPRPLLVAPRPQTSSGVTAASRRAEAVEVETTIGATDLSLANMGGGLVRRTRNPSLPMNDRAATVRRKADVGSDSTGTARAETWHLKLSSGLQPATKTARTN